MMSNRISTHSSAVLQALLVTFLWSTSWVLMKIGLEEIPPLTFAGLRYSLAFFFLALYAWRLGLLTNLRKLTPSNWRSLIILGLLFYTVTQGTVFLALTYLPAITLNLVLSFSSVFVALAGILLLREKPRQMQWLGIGLTIAGAFLFFYPGAGQGWQTLGLIVALVGLTANAISSILGRYVNHTLKLDPLIVTLVSMGVGGLTLLVVGSLIQGFPQLSGSNWAIVLWLAIVNSAFAFTLWNRTLRTLSAMESSVINNTMMIQIPILAWVFLDERPTGQQIFGLILAVIGVLLVQIRGDRGLGTRDQGLG
jgi:drug/metabolite transporter (DMT)-like permease